MIALNAQRDSFEQMLDVAFSRLMCCSLVCRVKTNPRFPSASVVAPTNLPGIFLTNSLFPLYYHFFSELGLGVELAETVDREALKQTCFWSESVAFPFYS